MAAIAKEALDGLLLITKAYCALHVTSKYLCSIALVYGPSMLPTFNLSGDYVLVEKISPRFGKVGTGDVVIVRSPETPGMVITKRVVGMEGDTVTYVVDPKNSDRTATLVVPKGHIWIQGDNIYNSKDSRKFGAVPYGLLQGRVIGTLCPRDHRLIGRKRQGVVPVK